MSRSDDLREAQRWLGTAGEDLKAVKVLLDQGLYSHACFMAQQCGEKAVKALWYAAGEQTRGHRCRTT